MCAYVFWSICLFVCLLFVVVVVLFYFVWGFSGCVVGNSIFIYSNI